MMSFVEYIVAKKQRLFSRMCIKMTNYTHQPIQKKKHHEAVKIQGKNKGNNRNQHSE